MTVEELYRQAETSYPPTAIVVRTVCKRIGMASEIAKYLGLGHHGARSVRKWIGNPTEVPFSVWFALLALDEIGA